MQRQRFIIYLCNSEDEEDKKNIWTIPDGTDDMVATGTCAVTVK